MPFVHIKGQSEDWQQLSVAGAEPLDNPGERHCRGLTGEDGRQENTNT